MAKRPSQLNELASLVGSDVLVVEVDPAGTPDVGHMQATNLATSLLGLSDTDELAEGSSNLYYTDVRVNGRIDTRVDKAFVDALNVDADTLDGNHASAFALSGHGHSNATTTVDGFMASTDKSKLDGVEAGAQVNPADTDALSEGTTNLYYTDVRAAAAAPVQTVNGETGTVTVAGSPLLRDFVATGAIGVGKPVALNVDGAVEEVKTISYTEGQVDEASTPPFGDFQCKAAYHPVEDVYMVLISENPLEICTATINNGTLSFSSATQVSADDWADRNIVYHPPTNQFVIIGQNATVPSSEAIVGTLTNGSFSFGTPVQYLNNRSFSNDSVYDPESGKIVAVYTDLYGTGDGMVCACSVTSGQNISFGNAVAFNSGRAKHTKVVYDDVSTNFVISYQDYAASDSGKATVVELIGNTFIVGTEVQFDAGGINDLDAVGLEGEGKVALAYEDIGNSQYGTSCIGIISGTNISFGSPVILAANQTDSFNIGYHKDANKINVTFSDRANFNYGTIIIGDVVGDTVNFGTEVVYHAGDGWFNKSMHYYEPSKEIFFVGRTSANGKGYLWQNGYTGTNADNFIGISQAALSNGQTGKIALKGAVDENQSGLRIGADCFLGDDGTITEADNRRRMGRAIGSNALLMAAE